MPDPKIAALLRDMAAQAAAAAPPGWQDARLRCTTERKKPDLSVLSYGMPDGQRRRGALDLSGSAGRLRELTGTFLEKLTVALTADPSGRFEATVGETELSGPTLYERELDGSLTPPDRGDEQDGPPSSATPAGDPDEAVRLLRRYLRLRAEIIGHEEELPPPADPSDLAALEEEIGVALPADLRALYGICDGDRPLETGLLNRWPWFGADQVANVHAHWEEWAEREWEDEPHMRPVFDANPPGAVRRSLNRPGWIPFAHSTGGDHLAVDMDPGPAGRPGQVIRTGVSHAQGPHYVADSITTFLRRLVEALERGDHTYEPGDLRYEADLPDRHEAEEAREWNVTGSPSLSPGAHPLVQRLRATHTNDLAFVRQAPSLNTLDLTCGTSLDLTPLRDVPLESVVLNLPSIDLTPLTLRSDLRALTLTARTPVDLAPLRGLPHLWALDISRAPVDSIEVIADLDNLCYLALRHDQWKELWRRTDRLPVLAAVRLHAVAPAGSYRLMCRYGSPPQYYSGAFTSRP
ncbi:SMI1/KNR4 family protein [Streptomyces sp. NPDC048483]|uniref:SMI1/KNR4 family protein n=1 Tax=Streptomyces sp. NPDC048483 TaxID=3154927 RepID=UPI0034191340